MKREKCASSANRKAIQKLSRVYCTFQKRYSDYIIMISYYFESMMDGNIGYVEGKNKL